jgi:hypothetical protein
MFAESEKNRQLASKLLHAAHRIWVEDTDLVPVPGPSRNKPFKHLREAEIFANMNLKKNIAHIAFGTITIEKCEFWRSVKFFV